jgi:hypothetical protein
VNERAEPRTQIARMASSAGASAEWKVGDVKDSLRKIIEDEYSRAVAERGRFVLGVSGGSLPAVSRPCRVGCPVLATVQCRPLHQHSRSRRP